MKLALDVIIFNMKKPAAADGSDVYNNKIKSILASASNEAELYKAIVNAPFHDLLRALQIDLGTIVLLLVNTKTKTIDRIALSDTEAARGAVRMSNKPFEKIKIPLSHKTNIISKALATSQPQNTEDWRYLFAPALNAQEAHFNQAGAGIESSYVYPVSGKKTGALIFSLYQPISNISNEHTDFMQFYSKLVTEKI